MKYELINTPNPRYSAKKQILVNRGLKETEIEHYLNLTDADINEPEVFGERLMSFAAGALLDIIAKNNDIAVIVDCDCDGYTSAAILINYICDISSKEWVEKHVNWFMHEGKQHGLQDCMDWLEDIGPDLVIIPDAGSNDIEQIAKLRNNGREVIVLDHHEIEGDKPNCFLINSQSPEYPNKELSGAGVVWQFCRFIDKIKNTSYANWYLDLVALGLDGDMMSLRSCETRRLIFKGLEPDNIRNPFIYEMWQKNKFKLGDTPTAWGATFYIVPLVNAITRSGTLEEKELIFNSMLRFKAFEQIPSNKRGHKVGETERLVDQAVRTCTNVKNRQTRAEEAGLELVEHLIKDNNMMDHKVLLFLLEPGAIKAEIRGLIANKLMAKYQRPCCMLTKRVIQSDGGDIRDSSGKIIHIAPVNFVTYEGSARGCDKVGVTEFKDICAGTGICEYTVGHQGAFGLGLRKENIETFIEKTDESLSNMASEPVYYVDYIWNANDVDTEAILEIAEMDRFWGKDIEEAYVAIQGIQVTGNMITMMASNTMKISLPNGVSIIKFRTPDEEYEELYSKTGYVEINIVGRCNRNEWNGNVSAQIMLDAYEIKKRMAWVF